MTSWALSIVPSWLQQAAIAFDHHWWILFEGARTAYLGSRVNFIQAASAFDSLRHSTLAGGITVVAFLAFTLPRQSKSVRDFFSQIVSKHPLPAFRRGGVTDADIERTRKVLFFYFLFLSYQLVQFPFTHWADGPIPKYADFIIQVALITLVMRSYGQIRSTFRADWVSQRSTDPFYDNAMGEWLNSKLDGINVRWRDMRWLAASIFAVNFGPWALANLPRALDAVFAIR